LSFWFGGSVKTDMYIISVDVL